MATPESDEKTWNDETHTGVVAVNLWVGNDDSGQHKGIYAIQVEYDDEGTRSWGSVHGTKINEPSNIQFNYKTELLKAVRLTNRGFVRSIALESNVRNHGPVGEEYGTATRLTPSGGGAIKGFKGSVDEKGRLKTLELVE